MPPIVSLSDSSFLNIKSIAFKLTFFCFLLPLCITYAAKVDTVFVSSKAMNKRIPNLVILPDSDTDKKQVFPVLYLLHGAGGTFTDWISKVPEIKLYADQHQMIIVCPDGGWNSWYFDSPVDHSYQYETYITIELVSQIDKLYHTIQNKKGRAITGLSMGGHGAFFLSFRHQGIWGAAGSMSGGLDIRPFFNNWDLDKRLGPYVSHKENWETHTVENLIYLLDNSNLKLIIDCGVDDFFFQVNERFHKKLMRQNIPHDFITRPGEHNWSYWQNAIKYQALFFSNFFNELKQ